MNDFVEECRREWTRLRVPDPIANEMAADLAADLAEAEADGVSPEQVLGSGAFDPRAFAAAWARARGVTGPTRSFPGLADPGYTAYPPVGRWLPRPARITAAIAAAAVALTLVVGLAIVTSRSRQSTAVSAAQVFPQPPPAAVGRSFAVDVGPGGDGRVRVVGVLVLLVGVAGLVGLVLYWSPWANPARRSPRYPPIDDHLGGPRRY